MSTMSKIVVIGGGTAGWLSAIYAKKYYPHESVRVIASSEIGILGAGEGSTPHFIDFLKEVDIEPADIVKHARGTFKNGIKFTNWRGDGQAYYRGLLNSQRLDLDTSGFSDKDIEIMQLEKLAQDQSFDDILGMRLISDQHQVKYRQDTLEQVGPISMHFDASLLAKFLQGVAVSRGIELIDDEVIDVETDSDDYITGFGLKSGCNVPADFVIDCSGFRRLLIGQHYQSPWCDYHDSLPVNRAIPFFLQNDSHILPPYTESIAMRAGWIWRIPVQGRYGCGYVFDRQFATDEEAKREVTELLGFEPEFPRVFDFQAGCFENVCVKNCVAVGLSAGFIEPLEATSIWVTMTALRMLKDRITRIQANDAVIIQEYNHIMKSMNEDILNFLHFHYLTDRSDSEFWRSFRERTRRPDLIKDIEDMGRRVIPSVAEFEYINQVLSGRLTFVHNDAYNSIHYLPIAAGSGFFDPKIAQMQLDGRQSRLGELMRAQQGISATLMDHWDYLEHLKSH